MNLWNKLVLLVLVLACLIEQVMTAPKKAAKPAPKKAAPAKSSGKGKGKKRV
jgi:hypothetical protein